jgi:hypothetical protein
MDCNVDCNWTAIWTVIWTSFVVDNEFYVVYECPYAFFLLTVIYAMLMCYVNCLDAI